MAPPASELLDIPEDVRIRILVVLDTVSLLRCKRLCHATKDLIDSTVELKYKLALARAGRVEHGGQSSLCIADRLRALETLCADGFSLETLEYILLPDEVIPHWPGVTDGFIPYLTNNQLDLVIWRPDLSASGAPEDKRVVPAVSKSRSQSVMGALAVDVAQDLLVFSRPARPEISPPECHVYSISEARPHPEAAGPFRIAFDPVYTERGFGTIEDLQIFGDVIAWSITDDEHSAVHVWNWKTSVLVWHQQSRTRSSCCRVISPSHVVLVTAQSVSIYPFDSDVDRSPQPASLATALCVLELPKLKLSRFTPYVRAYMQFPPSTPAHPNGPTPFFGLDPALTVLTIAILQSIDCNGNVLPERYAIFVPLQTLFKRIKAASTSIRDTTRRRTVPWVEWGPEGTRIVRLAHISHISVMGSRSAFMLTEGYDQTIHIVLFDVRRGAGDENTKEELENLWDDEIKVMEVLKYPQIFAEEVRTTFPVEVSHRMCGVRSGYLLQDAIAISHEAWGGQPALGQQWYDPENWM